MTLLTAIHRPTCYSVSRILMPFLKPVCSICHPGKSAMHQSTTSTGSDPSQESKETVSDDDDVKAIDPPSTLHLLNSLPESELKMLKFISAKSARTIVAHREMHGDFGKLEDLLEIAGIGRKTVAKLTAYVSSERPEKTSRIDPQSNMVVNLTSERLSALKDVVSVDIGLKHIAWLHMDRDRWVNRWHCREIEGISPGKWEPLNYFRVVSSAIEEMPNPDLYILEHKSFTSINNKGTFQTMLFVRCLESMFYTSLNRDIQDSGQLNAISLPQNIVGRHFNLLIGSQRKSGQLLVRNLLNEGLEKRNASLPVRLDHANLSVYEDSNRYIREHLTNCLLRAMAFFDIYVDKKPGFQKKH